MRQLDTVRKHSAKFEAALEKARGKYRPVASGELESLAPPPEPEAALEALHGDRPLESLGGAPDAAAFSALEAIILDELRPPYFILNDRIEIKGDYDRVDLIETNRGLLEAACRSVGRIDLINHPNLSYGGTGWLIEKDVAVTNRHVAQVFADTGWTDEYEFRPGTFGEDMEARLDYVRQHKHRGARRRADVLDVLYIAGPGEPDIAFLKVETHDDVEPLDLMTGTPQSEQPVAAIGYPAWDGGRNDPELMSELFDDVYDVKRFSPGLVTGMQGDGVIVLSDYTSLGGNSGSAVVDLATGKTVGLHFAGAFRDTNYAVASNIVAAARASLTTSVLVEQVPEEAPTKPGVFEGRDGYQADFLGEGAPSVSLPGLGAWDGDVAPVSDTADGVLNYRHFSVVQSKSRRLPLLTAVNIDGEKTFSLKRKGSWRLDGRLGLEHQVGNELYRRNRLDRGHMVRRMDPGWGDTRDEAQEGEKDTFHYTVCVPQHANLNQRDWLGLEDYVLSSADTRDFRISVFTGPVFRETDRTLKDQPGAEDIKIPEEFWKIAVMINADTESLSATAMFYPTAR